MIQSWWLFFLASWSCACTAAAVFCWFRVRKLLVGASARSIATLSMEVSELTSVCASLDDRLKRLNSRIGMREIREKRAAEPPATPDSSPPGDVGDKILSKAALREVARVRGIKIT